MRDSSRTVQRASTYRKVQIFFSRVSQPLTDEVVRAADVVITMGCGDACPIYPGKRYLDWDLPDPQDRSLEDVRAIRDEIDRRVRALVEELVPTAL